MSETLVFKVVCPHCQKKHAIPAMYVGKVVLCQICNHNFLVEGKPDTPVSTRSHAKREGFDPEASDLIDLSSADSIPKEEGGVEDVLKEIDDFISNSASGSDAFG